MSVSVLAQVQWVLFYVVLPVTVVLLVAVVGLIGTCWMYKVDFQRKKKQNPFLFIYRYHPNFFTFNTTLQSLQTDLNGRKALPLIADQLKISANELTAMPATIIYDDFKNITMNDTFRMAVGVIYTSNSLRFKSAMGRCNVKQLQRKLIGGGGKSSKLRAEDLSQFRVRLIPATDYEITFYPHTFGMLSYVLGAIRVFGDAAKKSVMKSPVIQILDASPFFGDDSNRGHIAYLFAQSNLRNFSVDMDMLRPAEKSAAIKQRHKRG